MQTERKLQMSGGKLTDISPPAEFSARELEVILTLVNRAQITGAEANEVVAVKNKLSRLMDQVKSGNGS